MMTTVLGDLDILDTVDEGTLQATLNHIKSQFQDFALKLEDHITKEMCLVGKEVEDLYARVDQLHSERGLPQFTVPEETPLRAMIPILQQRVAELEQGGGGGNMSMELAGQAEQMMMMEQQRQEQIRLDHERQERLNMAGQLRQEELPLCEQLGEQPMSFPGEPTDADLDAMSTRIHDLKTLKLTRQTELGECAAAVQGMMQTLGRQPDSELEFDAQLNVNDGTSLTPQYLAQMQGLRSQYEGMMQYEADECNQLRTQVRGYWDQLGEDPTRRAAFESRTQGVGPNVRTQLTTEVTRCLGEISGRNQTKRAIMQLRPHIELLWDDLGYSQQQRRAFKPYYMSGYDDQALAAHQQELNRLKQELQSRQQARAAQQAQPSAAAGKKVGFQWPRTSAAANRFGFQPPSSSSASSKYGSSALSAKTPLKRATPCGTRPPTVQRPALPGTSRGTFQQSAVAGPSRGTLQKAPTPRPGGSRQAASGLGPPQRLAPAAQCPPGSSRAGPSSRAAAASSRIPPPRVRKPF